MEMFVGLDAPEEEGRQDDRRKDRCDPGISLLLIQAVETVKADQQDRQREEVDECCKLSAAVIETVGFREVAAEHSSDKGTEEDQDDQQGRQSGQDGIEQMLKALFGKQVFAVLQQLSRLSARSLTMAVKSASPQA